MSVKSKISYRQAGAKIANTVRVISLPSY